MLLNHYPKSIRAEYEALRMSFSAIHRPLNGALLDRFVKVWIDQNQDPWSHYFRSYIEQNSEKLKPRTDATETLSEE